MKRSAAMLVVVALAFAVVPGAFANGFEGYTTISSGNGGSLTSAINIVYIFDTVVCPQCSYQTLGSHRIQESNGGGTVAQMQWGVMGVSYRANLDGSGASGSCYFATATAALMMYGCSGCPVPAPGGPYQWDTGGPWNSASTCITAPPPCQLNVYISAGGNVYNSDASSSGPCGRSVTLNATPDTGWHFVGWSGAVTSSSPSVTIFVGSPTVSETGTFEQDSGGSGDGEALSRCGADQNGCAEPLLIKLDDGAWKLAGLEDPVSFDINANGQRRLMGWTLRGDGTTAFLALDRNLNGTIDDGSELFGNATPAAGISPPANGFQALARYDENGDAVIDASDSIWDSLLLWVDANHNGISEPAELSKLSASAFTAVGVECHRSGRHDRSGNVFAFQGTIYLGHRARTIYDVFFVIQ